MRLVIRTNYYDYCNSWDSERYIEYSSAEKFLCDFEDWCKLDSEDRDGFLGMELYKDNLKGTECNSQVEVFTWEEWWEHMFTNVKENVNE